MSGGNSQLKPLVSDNVDLGVEWYFQERSVLGVALFYKDIASFISSPTTQEPLRPEDRAAVAAFLPRRKQVEAEVGARGAQRWQAHPLGANAPVHAACVRRWPAQGARWRERSPRATDSAP